MDQAEKLRKIVRQQNIPRQDNKPSQENKPRQAARVITVTSGKGGVGKSSIAVNLAIAISRLGKRVIIIDADFGLANVEVMLGIRPMYNLADLIFRDKNLSDIITQGPENIGFISGGSGIQELTNLTKDQIIYLIGKLVELDNRADVIIIDTGAGINNAVLEFVAASSEVLLLITPEPTSITDAYALLKTLNRRTDFSAEDTVIKMIANRITPDEDGEVLFNKLNTVVTRFLKLRLEYFGQIPLDNSVSKAVIKQNPAICEYPNSSFSKLVTEFAKELFNTEPNTSPGKKGIAQLFSILLRSRIKNV